MPYAIHDDPRYAPLERIEAGRLADECQEPWWNQSLAKINDAVTRLAVIQGEFHWHKHDREDELFFVLEGELLIDLDGRPTVALGPREGLVVPRGCVHRTRAVQRTVVLLVEAATAKMAGDP